MPPREGRGVERHGSDHGSGFCNRALTPDNNGVPQNCEQLTFDAYCRSTTNVPLLSTLLVQEDKPAAVPY